MFSFGAGAGRGSPPAVFAFTPPALVRADARPLLRCWCGQNLAPPHSLHVPDSRGCGHALSRLLPLLPLFLPALPRGAAFVAFAVMAHHFAPLEDAPKHVHGTTWTPGVPLTAADVLKVAFLPCPSSPARRLRPRQTVCLAKLLSPRGSLPLFVLPLAFYASWHRKRGGDKA
jgi:hypothetical protein